jgi:hypothetical protein
MTVHEWYPDNQPLHDESLTDFQLLQPGHFGWPTIAVEIGRLDLLYGRRDLTKPIVIGEIGYEHLADEHFEDFQRNAFWLGMLNGAAGYTYGDGGDSPYSYEKDTKMLPGSYQIGMGAKLLQGYSWWRFAPHPEWVTPRGTTLLESRSGSEHSFHMDLIAEWHLELEPEPPSSEWSRRKGNFRLPYAAGIPGEVRFVYVPHVGLGDYMMKKPPPTVLRLEPGVLYHAYYWSPESGVKVDLGAVERPSPGTLILADGFDAPLISGWTFVHGDAAHRAGRFSTKGSLLAVIDGTAERDVVASVDALGRSDAGLVLRYRDAANFVAAIYSAKKKEIYLVDRKDGSDGDLLGVTPVTMIGASIHLSVEVRNGVAAAMVTDGVHTYSTPIVDVANLYSGLAGLLHRDDSSLQRFDHFELRNSPSVVTDSYLERKLYDARGDYRGELTGPLGTALGDYAVEKDILMDSYRPPAFPALSDWLLVLNAEHVPG